MPASAVFDLHCDTLTAFMDPTRCRDTLDDPLSSFALSKIPQGVSWCQCCAIFIPDGVTPKEAEGYYAFHQRSFIRQMGCLSSQVLPCRTADDICSFSPPARRGVGALLHGSPPGSTGAGPAL